MGYCTLRVHGTPTSYSSPQDIAMAPSIFSVVSPSPLAGTLLRFSAIGSLVIAGTKLYLAPTTTRGVADQPLSAITAPAKAEKLAYYQNASWFVVAALVQLRFSYTGIPSVLDKAVFAVLSLQYAIGGLGNYRLGFSKAGLAYAAAFLPLVGSLFD